MNPGRVEDCAVDRRVSSLVPICRDEEYIPANGDCTIVYSRGQSWPLEVRLDFQVWLVRE